MTEDEVKKAWAYAPKHGIDSRARSDLSAGTWQTVNGTPTLVGKRYRATPSKNEKGNISFKVEKATK